MKFVPGSQGTNLGQRKMMQLNGYRNAWCDKWMRSFLLTMIMMSTKTSPVKMTAYWTYVPDPTLLHPVSWDDPEVLVYVNNTWLLDFPAFEGTQVKQTLNFSGIGRGHPLCFTRESIHQDYLPVSPVQVIGRNAYHSKVGVAVQASLCNQANWNIGGILLSLPTGVKNDSLTSPMSYPPCEKGDQRTCPRPMVPWTRCFGETPTIYSWDNDPAFTVMDWSIIKGIKNVASDKGSQNSFVLEKSVSAGLWRTSNKNCYPGATRTQTEELSMPLYRIPGWLNAVACGVLLLSLHVEGQDSASPIRNTHTGQVQGSLVHVRDTDIAVHTFLGIPFAKPPVGPLRFAPPEAPEPWSGVRDGTSYPAMCLQNDMMDSEILNRMKLSMPPVSMSEDCLYLNIYTPTHAHEGSNLPVMVWIHGGGLVVGMASMYDGSVLASIEDVVVVTIQYRLGVLGFFSTGDQHARGNWGYLDQVAALRWVQQNIAHFGGNPDRVTIFGESAGGISVSSHVVSPMSQGLFHGAIMESGVTVLPGLISSSSEVVYNIVANLSGCAAVNSETLVHCLRSKSEAEILAINKVFKMIPAVVDGEFLPKHPQELLASDDFHPVPSIIGATNDEFGYIIPLVRGSAQKIKEITRETLPAFLKNTAAKEMMLPPECGDLLMEEYMGDTEDPQTLQIQYTEMMGDFMFMIPALQVAHFQRSHAPVYFYEFQHRPSFLKDFRPPHVKADHGDEVSFVFGYLVSGIKPNTNKEELLSRKIMKYWANFARHGNPNSEGLPYWPVLDHEEQYLQLDIQPAVGRALRARRLKFWTKTLPQKIQELKQAQERHKEL